MHCIASDDRFQQAKYHSDVNIICNTIISLFLICNIRDIYFVIVCKSILEMC